MKPIEGVGTSTACFLGEASRGRPFYPTFITSWSEYERLFGGLQKDAHMPLAVFHFFANGGKRAYIVRLLDPDPAKAPAASAQLEFQDGTKLKLVAAGGGTWANSITVLVRLSATGGNPYEPNPPDDDPPPLFDFVVQRKVDGETFDLEVLPRLGVQEGGERFYASMINHHSNYIRVELGEKQDEFPEQRFKLTELEDDDKRKFWGDELKLGKGGDGDSEQVFADAALKKAFLALDALDELNILVIPGRFEKAIVGAGIDYVAKRRDIIYIIDSPGDPRNRTEREEQITNVKDQLGKLNKDSHAALYFPWIEISDPYSRIPGATRFAPPSGAIAGLYARTDNRRGVWKAPAGTEATILGAVGLAVEVTDNDQEALNPIGVNCIRQFPDSGIVCWGSRTLATRQDPEYRYVPVRRFAMFLAKSLYRGTQWVVFEPNDEPLWAAIRFNLNAFMLRQFRAGALQGGKPEEAFFVKCDAENNPQASIDAGEVHITVGFAPLKPAEFVIIHLTQIRKE